MTEDQIERMVEIRMNALDRRLLEGTLPQENYDRLVKSLDDWAKNLYDNARHKRTFGGVR